jgi:dihydroorotate dehydrogenase (NAD+) catalytic subunit
MIKLSPNVTSIAEMARVCEGEGADALALVNTLQAMDVDIETRRPVLRNVLGGLSGPAIRPVALRMVWQASRAVGLPVCGIGGIATAEDALKLLLCGATAVQVGTANYLNPMAAGEVAAGLEAWAVAHDVARLSDLVGALEVS